jgi:hypothetical protein
MKTAKRKTDETNMERVLQAAADYFQSRWGMWLSVSEVKESKTSPGCCHIFPEVSDDRLPQLLSVRYSKESGSSAVIPYYAVFEHPDRQIVSYFLGKGRCNLAEIAEIDSRLYSRSCGSYRVEELPHQDEESSRIGLWVHDCLTEDLDHSEALNRRNLPNGVCISYDFGMAFSSRYYPPFYTFELGLSDDSILKHGSFLLSLLSGYAELLQTDENKMIGILSMAYPETHNEQLGRYYLRNFKVNFPVRLYYGRLIEKLRDFPFEKKKLRNIADAIGIQMDSVDGWEYFLKKLTALKYSKLNLRGLNLSGADLRKACLRGADLRDTNLSEADLAGADLREADLRGSTFDHEKLKQARIDGARF